MPAGEEGKRRRGGRGGRQPGKGRLRPAEPSQASEGLGFTTSCEAGRALSGRPPEEHGPTHTPVFPTAHRAVRE